MQDLAENKQPMRPSSRPAFPVSGWDNSGSAGPQNLRSMLAVAAAVAAESIVPVEGTAAEADIHPVVAAVSTDPEANMAAAAVQGSLAHSHLGSGWDCTAYPASFQWAPAARLLRR